MFIEALFITAMIWKQSKCQSTDEAIKKKIIAIAVEYYSAWADLEITILSKVLMSQKEKDKYHMMLFKCGI